MRRGVALAGLVSVGLGCGDNQTPRGPALAPAAELVIAAHPGDDLMHMQPDLLDAITRGGGVTTVYVTAGNGTSTDTDAWTGPRDGVKSAYARAAGARLADWDCGVLVVEDHATEHCRLADAGLSLVFLGYPEGDAAGDAEASLMRLWNGSITSSNTLGVQSTRYEREHLIETVTQLVRETGPDTLRTLEAAGTVGTEHADHLVTGALALVAHARAASRAEVIAYRADGLALEPATASPAVLATVSPLLAHFVACTTGCAACGDGCSIVPTEPLLAVERRYATGIRVRGGGRLRSGNQCLDDGLQLVSCPAAPTWQLDSAGELRTRDACLTTDGAGELALRPCTGGVQRRFFVDDSGRVIAGAPPPADPTGITDDDGPLWCLENELGDARLARCSRASASRWELVPDVRETLRTTLGLTATGREIRLADLTGDGKADLCAIEPGAAGLVCAPGDGAGGFLAAARIDAPGAPLAIEPRSLVIGDVDGDRNADACGRDAGGILCATYASGYAASRWSTAFADATARTTSAASLTAVDADGDRVAELCGVDASGVVCVRNGAGPEPRSAALPDDAIVWLADLDADERADWCTATDAGPACAVDAQRSLTLEAAPWAFSRTGQVDVAPATYATVALADIDGDDRADLCMPRDDRITCARSQGRGFGPRATTLAILPNQSVASGLWLGDLDGDGRADPCADTGTTIVCAVQPRDAGSVSAP